MFPKGKKIGVMMGGLSAEREISFKSGRAVFDALKKIGSDVVSIEISRETEEEVKGAIARTAVDVVFIALHGGFGEDGRLQHILDRLGIPYTGPGVQASRQAMNKMVSRKLFKKQGLFVARGRLWRKRTGRFWAALFLRYPLVVKPLSQGSSFGVSFVRVPGELPGALSGALKFGDEVLIEEYISGREVTVSVLDGRALPVVEIVTKNLFFDYEAKYQKGVTEYIVPAKLPEDVMRCAQTSALAAYQALGCRHLSRVDIIIREDNTPYILEVNTVPGMTETSLLPKAAKAAGISFEDVCLKLVDMAWNGRANGEAQ